MTSATVHGIRLHLGCGQVYKPGYLNIDALDESVADEISDISLLRFIDNTVDEIYASQLIEHFDYIHCKYVLSEWYRVLKSNGTLVIETPDLSRTYKKLVSTGIETQKNTLQWVFGLDSPGLLHKTGFTFSLLEDLLKEVGFDSIKKQEQQTHRYEPGLRVTAIKSIADPRRDFAAALRRRIATDLAIKDSYVLIPMEERIGHAVSMVVDGKLRDPDAVDRMLARLSTCHAQLGLACLKALIDARAIDEERARTRTSILQQMADMQFTQRSFTLWIKSRRERGVESEFAKFSKRVESTMLDVISGKRTMHEEMRYITGLEPTKISILDFRLAMMEARKYFNIGVKMVHQGHLPEALANFEKSERINPDNPLTHWNIARLGVSLGLGEVRISNSYEAAMSLAADRATRRRVAKEHEDSRKQGYRQSPKEPVLGD
jgi:predicted SAM-dependent methyltransferase